MKQKPSESKKKTKRAVLIHRPKKVVVSHDKSHRSMLSHSALSQSHASCRKKIKALLSNNKALAQALEVAQCDINIQNKTIVELQRRITLNKPQLIKSKLQSICEHLHSVVALLQEAMDSCDSEPSFPFSTTEINKTAVSDPPSDHDNAHVETHPLCQKSESFVHAPQHNARLYFKENFCNMSAIVEQSVLNDDISFPPILFSTESDQGRTSERRALPNSKSQSKSRSGNGRVNARNSVPVVHEVDNVDCYKYSPLHNIGMYIQNSSSEPKDNCDFSAEKLQSNDVEGEINQSQSIQNSVKKNSSSCLQGILKLSDNENNLAGTDKRPLIFHNELGMDDTVHLTEKEQIANENDTPSERLSVSRADINNPKTPNLHSEISLLKSSKSTVGQNQQVKNKRDTFVIPPAQNDFRRKTFVVNELSCLQNTCEQEIADITNINKKNAFPSLTGRSNLQISNNKLEITKKVHSLQNTIEISHSENMHSSNKEVVCNTQDLSSEETIVKSKEKTADPLCNQETLQNITCVMVDDMELTRPLGAIITLQQGTLLNPNPSSVSPEQAEPLSGPVISSFIADHQYVPKEKPMHVSIVARETADSIKSQICSSKSTVNNTDIEGNNAILKSQSSCDHNNGMQKSAVDKNLADQIQIRNKLGSMGTDYNIQSVTHSSHNSNCDGELVNAANSTALNKQQSDCDNPLNDAVHHSTGGKNSNKRMSKYRKEKRASDSTTDGTLYSNDDKDPDYIPTQRRKKSCGQKMKSNLTSKKCLNAPQHKSKIPSLSDISKYGHKFTSKQKVVNFVETLSDKQDNQNLRKSTHHVKQPLKSVYDLSLSESVVGHPDIQEQTSNKNGKEKNDKSESLYKNKLDHQKESLSEKEPSLNTDGLQTSNSDIINIITEHSNSSGLQELKDCTHSSLSKMPSTMEPLTTMERNITEENPKQSSKKLNEGKVKLRSQRKKKKKEPLCEQISENELDDAILKPSKSRQEKRKRKKLFVDENYINISPLKSKHKGGKKSNILTPIQQQVLEVEETLIPLNTPTKMPSVGPFTAVFHKSLESKTVLTIATPPDKNFETNKQASLRKKKSSSKLSVQGKIKKISDAIFHRTSTGSLENELQAAESQNAEICTEDTTDGKTRKRRAASGISYKEIPLNLKLRREDVAALSQKKKAAN